MANPTPPPGGFQQGGWYEGRQYWNGTFSAPGQIHSESNQQGAGQMVSGEVLQQTSVAAGNAPNANANFIASQYPTSKEEVSPYLNNFQNFLLASSGSPETRMEELKGLLSPGTSPEPLNRIGEFEKLRTTQGVADLETTLKNLKAEEDTLYATFRQQKTTEEGKPVALGVISGRISEEERTYKERLDYVTRQKNTVIDELNTKYNLINTYMNFMTLDYNDAVDRYDKEFSQNLEIYKMIKGEEADEKDAARANLQIYTNLVTSGNMDYGSLSDDQKLMINKLEVQSGLPIGFMSQVEKDKDADVLFTTTNEGVTQVGFRNADGTVSVKSYGTKTGSAKYAATDEVTIASDALAEVDTNGDKMVSLKEYEAARKKVYSQIADPDKAASALNTASGEYSKWKW